MIFSSKIHATLDSKSEELNGLKDSNESTNITASDSSRVEVEVL
jgi:hypothetical protein